MKKQFINYLKSVGITTNTLINRVKQLYEVCVELCPEEIEDILVEEQTMSDGTNRYHNLSFFSKNYSVGARQFLHEDSFMVYHLNKSIDAINITKRNYDFKKPTAKSKLSVEIMSDNRVTGSFQVSKENCDSLKKIIFKYLIPNLRT